MTDHELLMVNRIARDCLARARFREPPGTEVWMNPETLPGRLRVLGLDIRRMSNMAPGSVIVFSDRRQRS